MKQLKKQMIFIFIITILLSSHLIACYGKIEAGRRMRKSHLQRKSTFKKMKRRREGEEDNKKDEEKTDQEKFEDEYKVLVTTGRLLSRDAIETFRNKWEEKIDSNEVKGKVKNLLLRRYETSMNRFRKMFSKSKNNDEILSTLILDFSKFKSNMYNEVYKDKQQEMCKFSEEVENLYNDRLKDLSVDISGAFSNENLYNFKTVVDKFKDFTEEVGKKYPGEEIKDTIKAKLDMIEDLEKRKTQLNDNYTKFSKEKVELLKCLSDDQKTEEDIKNKIKTIKEMFIRSFDMFTAEANKYKDEFLLLINSENEFIDLKGEKNTCKKLSIDLHNKISEIEKLFNFKYEKRDEAEITDAVNNFSRKKEDLWNECKDDNLKKEMEEEFKNAVKEFQEWVKEKKTDIQDAELMKKDTEKTDLFSLKDLFNLRTSLELDPESASFEEGQKLIDKEIPSLILYTTPPKFCWKKADLGYMPTNCPPQYVRRGAHCVMECDQIAKKRKKSCVDGYKPNGWFTCTCKDRKSHTFMVNPFTKDLLTNFNNDVTCNKPTHWHHGALCYKRSCPHFLPDYVNCGIGACAATKADCKAEVVKLVLNVIFGFTKFVITILTLGGGVIAQTALVNNVIASDKITITLETIVNTAKSLIKIIIDLLIEHFQEKHANKHATKTEKQQALDLNKLQSENFEEELMKNEDIYKESLEEALDNEAEGGLERLVEIGDHYFAQVVKNPKKRDWLITKATDKLYNAYKDKLENTYEAVGHKLKDEIKDKVKEYVKENAKPEKRAASFWKRQRDKIVQAFKNFIGQYKNCSEKGKAVESDKYAKYRRELECTKAIVGTIAFFDSTGFLGIAAAFMHPKCPEEED